MIATLECRWCGTLSLMRIVLTGGGTGGHVTPLLAVAQALRARAARGEIPSSDEDEPDLEMIAVGTISPEERQVFQTAGLPAVYLASGKIRRYLSGVPVTVIDLLFRLPLGILQAFWKLFVLMPDVVFSKGGYGSVPVTIVSWVYRIPVLLHETDVVPGLANRRLARFVSAVAVSFRVAEASFPAAKVFVSGTPLRPAFLRLVSSEVARQRLGLHEQLPVLFVTGGSQGAQRLNTALLAILLNLLPDMQVLHQAGELNVAAVRDFVAHDLRHVPGLENYHLVGTLSAEDMALSLAASDVVMSRAGGTTLAEIAAAGKPAILIPLRGSAGDHQWENAYFFREHGAAVVLDETNLTPSVLLSAIKRLFAHAPDRQIMAERVRTLHRPSAAEDLVGVLLEMAQGKVPRRSERLSTPSPS